MPAWWQRDVPNQCIVQITTDETSRVHFDCRRQAVMPRTESTMANQVFCDISISADGYVAGPGQTAGRPFGDGPVDQLHAWMFDTPDENKAEIDQVVAAGAFVMGRNMFGPGRSEWDLRWKGWWGDNPPYHAPVFVLTHHPREPLTIGAGERLFDGVPPLNLGLIAVRGASLTTHISYR